MNILGMIQKNKKEIWLNKKLVDLNNLFVFVKGKIFNLNELCTEYKLEKSSEENVIKEMYKQQGIDCIQKLDGDFAIIIYDPSCEKLFLAKDKLGSVSIYYSYVNESLLFATSLKDIMNYPLFDKKIDKQVLANYLGYMYIYEPFTIFENTYKLEKGTILEFSHGKVCKNNYFNLYDAYQKVDKIYSVTDEQLIKEFTNLFYQSIKKRGDKNSRVGIFMSSGKDSSLLAKMANDVFDKKVNTYTLGFENDRDESKSALAIANYIGSNHHSILLKDKDVLDTIHKIPLIYEEPFADPSTIPNIYLTEHIQDKNDFYLTGEGNDAIFVASSMYHIYNFYPRIKLFVKKIINIYNKKRVYKTSSEMAQINIVSRFNYSDKIVNKKGKVYPLKKLKDKRRAAVIGDLTNTVQEKYKMKTASLAKYHNYNYYTPFYEPEILLKTFSIPINKMYQKGHGKYIFEKILYDNIPSEYYKTYKKNGFGIPIVDWMKRMMLTEVKELSKKEFILEQQLFNYQNLEKLIHNFEENPDYNKAVVLWCYYVFQLWYKENMM